MVTTSGQPQQLPKFCSLCTPTGRPCPNNFLLPIHQEWSDPEEEKKDLNKQEEEEKEGNNWDSTIQNRRKKKNKNTNKVMRKIPN